MIHVTGDWYLDSDGQNEFTIERRIKKDPSKAKTGGKKRPDDEFRVLGHYSTLDGAMKGLLNRMEMNVAFHTASAEIGEYLAELRSERKVLIDAFQRAAGELENENKDSN